MSQATQAHCDSRAAVGQHFFVKGQRLRILDFAGCILVITQFCPCGKTATIDNTGRNGQVYVPIKLI